MHAGGVWTLAGQRHLGLIAAGVAFFAMLAIFPAVSALISVAALMTEPETVSELLDTATEFLPEEAFDLISDRADTMAGRASGTLGLTSAVSLLLALWSARLGTGALADGLTAIHGAKSRGGLKGAVVALLLTLLMIGVGLTAITAMLIVPLLMALASFFIGSDGFLFLIAEALRWVVALGSLIVGLGLLYRYGPNRPPERRSPFLSPGLALALTLWIAASLAFTFYMANFGNYDEVYGSLGAAIVLMLWFYMSAYAVLLGAALNHWLETRPKSGRDQSAVEQPGPNQPESDQSIAG